MMGFKKIAKNVTAPRTPTATPPTGKTTDAMKPTEPFIPPIKTAAGKGGNTTPQRAAKAPKPRKAPYDDQINVKCETALKQRFNIIKATYGFRESRDLMEQALDAFETFHKHLETERQEADKTAKSKT